MFIDAKNENERGSILLVVLLFIMLISAVALTVSLNVKAADTLQSNHLDKIRSRQLVSNALVLAKLEFLSETPPSDSDILEFELEGGGITLRFSGESGKVGLNSASQPLLHSLISLMDSGEQSDVLSSAIIDFRDANNVALAGNSESLEYKSYLNGLSMKNRRFEQVDEICQIIPYRLCQKLLPHVTVWNSSIGFDLSLSGKRLSEAFGTDLETVQFLLNPYQYSQIAKNYEMRINVETKGGSNQSEVYYILRN